MNGIRVVNFVTTIWAHEMAHRNLRLPLIMKIDAPTIFLHRLEKKKERKKLCSYIKMGDSYIPKKK